VISFGFLSRYPIKLVLADNAGARRRFGSHEKVSVCLASGSVEEACKAKQVVVYQWDRN